MKKLKILLCALALTAAVPVMAQPVAGDWEIELGGSGDSDNEFESGGFAVTGSLGYYYTDNLEVGIRQNVGFNGRGRDEDELWSGFTALAADWNFQLGKFVPFVGANAGIYYDENGDSWFAAPEAGVKYYIHEKTYIFARGEYQWFFDSIERANNNFDSGRFRVTLGVGFNIGGRR